MNIKKTGASLTIVFSMLAFNAAAQADCTKEIEYIKQAADNVRCADDGLWTHKPIWQKAAGKGRDKKDPVGDGCEVHQSIAKKLYEVRDEYNTNTMPPYKGAKNKNGKNIAAGAAQELESGKFQAAIDSLTAIELAVDDSVVNPDFKILPDPWNTEVHVGDADYWADKVRNFATVMKARIDPEFGCPK